MVPKAEAIPTAGDMLTRSICCRERGLREEEEEDGLGGSINDSEARECGTDKSTLGAGAWGVVVVVEEVTVKGRPVEEEEVKPILSASRKKDRAQEVVAVRLRDRGSM